MATLTNKLGHQVFSKQFNKKQSIERLMWNNIASGIYNLQLYRADNTVETI